MYGCVINRPAQVNHTVRSIYGAGRKRRKIIAALKRKFLVNVCVYIQAWRKRHHLLSSMLLSFPTGLKYLDTWAPQLHLPYIHTYTVKENGDSNTHYSMSKPSSVHALFPLESNPPNKHVCMSLCMYALCMYVHMYVCIYACIYMNMNE